MELSEFLPWLLSRIDASKRQAADEIGGLISSPRDQVNVWLGRGADAVRNLEKQTAPKGLFETSQEYGDRLANSGLNLVGAAQAIGSKVPQGLLGLYPETTAGRIINKTRGEGGYSVNLPTGDIPSSGIMMGRYANTSPHNTVVEKLRPQDVAAHVDKNASILDTLNNYLGTWVNKDTGKTYLDVSARFNPEEVRKATKFGEKTGQLAGWDVGASKEIPVGNWTNFVRSPEFAGRMNQMEQEGSQYLSKFPAKEWWDMHGGPFERVYGKENLPQVAGFTASTAPNAAPRENLQTMSEYMRRFIKQEPIIQPEWRVPEGEMTRQAGKKIGMEQSRASNLRKSEQGLLGQLQQDKVREEAQAMMGDPNAVVLDRHWARLAEDPSRGIFTAAQPGIVEPGKQYLMLKDAVAEAARQRGMDPRNYSANVWTGIREHIKNNSDLFGQKFRGSAITGDSKSYADHFEHLIEDKANHLGITKSEMEQRLRAGDATLLSMLIATPLGAYLYGQVTGQGEMQ